MTTEELAVIAHALRWWRGHRPIRWTENAHLDSPIVNTKTESEARLAKACARMMKARRAKR